MIRQVGALLVVLFVMLAAANLVAQGEGSQACSLLTSSEISAAVGTPGAPHGGDMPLPQGKGEIMKMCNWRLPTGGLHLSYAKAPQGGMRDAGLAQTRESFKTLKSQGWTIEEKAFGNVSCVIMTPPAGKQDLPNSTNCFGDAKGMGIGLGTITKTRITIEKIKTLIDDAIGRLP